MEVEQDISKGSRKPHKKSRLGCGNCKRRRIKCDERKPTCSNCARHNMTCDFSRSAENTNLASPHRHSQAKPKRKFVASGYEVRATPSSSITDAHSSPVGTNSSINTPNSSHATPAPAQGLNIAEMEIWHHYLMKTCASVAGDGLKFWKEKLPEIGFSYPFVLQLILSLSAFHLARSQPEKQHIYLQLAEMYHTTGIQGATPVLASLDESNCEAMYSSATLVSFCSLARGPQPGDFLAFSSHGPAELFNLLRGIRAIAAFKQAQTRSAPIVEEDAPKPFTEPFRPCPDYKPPISELRWFINSNSELLAPFSETYFGALDALLRSFQSVYATAEENSKNEDRHSQMVFAWLYRASDEYIRCLQEKQPIALIIFSFFAVLLRETENQWFMGGWVHHIIGGVRQFVPDDLQQWLKWPIEQTKFIATDGQVF
ncbi:hypothetical protein BKA64DRAFT_693346 [Cadophora sp. MPI-SDFR-AT-0126]|nr:hypothetical protein BKA64DRAFT_693346 [Leotiomycetes sp. MPI-SDFR-AT-0126]